MVGFIEHHQVVGLGFQQILVAIAPSHQVTGDQHKGLCSPGIAAYWPDLAGRSETGFLPGQSFAVIDGPVEAELLAQFPLPLLEHRRRCHDQHAAGPAAQPGLAQQ